MIRLLLLSFCLICLSCQGQDESVTQTPIHVALVFDDGPVPEHASAYLALFEKEDVHATFSLVESNLEKYEELGRAYIAAGHEVNNHSFDHLHPGNLDDAALEHEIGEAQKCFTEKLGEAPRFYWPPFLEVNDAVKQKVAAHGLSFMPMNHLVGTDDWNMAVPAEVIYEKAITGVVDGSVILFHETRKETLELMPAIIDELKRQGCVFMTFSELADYLEE